MGCTFSKSAADGRRGGQSLQGPETWQPPTSSPLRLPRITALKSTSHDADTASSPTSSDSSVYSQLSTWDMRTLHGTMNNNNTPSSRSRLHTTSTDTVNSHPPPLTPLAAILSCSPGVNGSEINTHTSSSPLSSTPTTAVGCPPFSEQHEPFTSPSIIRPSIIRPTSPLPLIRLNSLPSFSQRIRSPSILGMPSLGTPVNAHPQGTDTLVVTKLGGCTLVNQYLVVQYLGRGTSGKVFLCIDVLDKRLYAVKIVRKTGGTRELQRQMTNSDNDDLNQGDRHSEQRNARSGNEARISTPPPPPPPDCTSEGNESDKIHNPVDTNTSKGLGSKSKSKSKSKSRRGVPMTREPLEDIQREIQIMRTTAGHPNVVSLREVVDDPSSNKILIVMEYCEGGPVMTRPGLDRGRRIPEQVCRPYFRDMLAGLHHLHRNNIIHGDLKPENALMCSTGRLVLSDFGCSKILSHADQRIDRCNGTPAFLAPEMMYSGTPGFHGQSADAYSLGVCLFTLVYGRIPFVAGSVLELFELVKHKELEFPENSGVVISQELKDLLKGLLEKNPEKRLTLEQAAHHPWTTDGGRLDGTQLISSNSGSDTFDTAQQRAHTQHQTDGDKALMGMMSTSVDDLQVATFKSGDWLARQGDKSTYVMYLLAGEVELLYKPVEDASLNIPLIRGRYTTRDSSSTTPAEQQQIHAADGRSITLTTTTTTTTATIEHDNTDNTEIEINYTDDDDQINVGETSRVTAAASRASPFAYQRPSSGVGLALPPLRRRSHQERQTLNPSPRTVSHVPSPRLLGAALLSPEHHQPSPRILGTNPTNPRGWTSTSNSHFHLNLGMATICNAALAESAVTTPSLTPLPSARDGGGVFEETIATTTANAGVRGSGTVQDTALRGNMMSSLNGDGDDGGAANSGERGQQQVEEGIEEEERGAQSLHRQSSTRIEAHPVLLRSCSNSVDDENIEGDGSAVSTTMDTRTNQGLTKIKDAEHREPPPKATMYASLWSAAQQASQSLASLRKNIDETTQYVLAIRGAGDFLGETALIGGSSTRRLCSIRAIQDDVMVVMIPYAIAKDYTRKNPIAKQRLAELVWARQSETIVLEGLIRLVGISLDLKELI